MFQKQLQFVLLAQLFFIVLCDYNNSFKSKENLNLDSQFLISQKNFQLKQIASPPPYVQYIPSPSGSCLKYRGVNQASADFGGFIPGVYGSNIPGIYGSTYEYPEPNGSTSYFVKQGANTMRMPYLLERLIPDGKNINPTEWGHFLTSVDIMLQEGCYVILDAHNYFHFFNVEIGTSNCIMSNQDFANFYAIIANEFKNNNRVIIALMNQPAFVSSENMIYAFYLAIQAIRATGAQNTILVSGNGFDNAISWNLNWYGTPNTVSLLNIFKTFGTDSNILVEVHVYYDSDSGGTTDVCVSSTIGSQRLAVVTTWLQQNGLQGILTEFGAASSSICLEALNDTLSYLTQNCDVWQGFTYWAAGPLWGTYMFSVDPTDPDPQPRPQEKVISSFF